MSDAKPVVVADTVIFLQASINETNVASSFLRRVEAGEVTLCISRLMMEEIRDVLSRPEIRAKNARLSDEALEEFIRSVEENALLIDPLPAHYQYERDPKDEHVLNLAIEAKAQYIISRDNDLLDLMDSSRPAGSEFQRQHPDITILGPGEFITQLNLLRPKTS
jgi:uncharacterized protein